LPPRLPSSERLRLALAAAGLALLAAAPAVAIEFATVEPRRDAEGRIGVTFRLDDPLEPRVEESLARGMPATLLMHAELWRKRNGWFDRVERSIDATVRLRQDVWARAWLLERAGLPPIVVSSVDSLEFALSRPFELTFPGSGRLPSAPSYFVVLSATVKPLSVEDAEEVEGWLSGEVRGQRGSGFGAITAIPRALFDTVRNIAGLGDTRARAVSAEFSPRNLERR
jgi:hypothetical protein